METFGKRRQLFFEIPDGGLDIPNGVLDGVFGGLGGEGGLGFGVERNDLAQSRIFGRPNRSPGRSLVGLRSLDRRHGIGRNIRLFVVLRVFLRAIGHMIVLYIVIKHETLLHSMESPTSPF